MQKNNQLCRINPGKSANRHMALLLATGVLAVLVLTVPHGTTAYAQGIQLKPGASMGAGSQKPTNEPIPKATTYNPQAVRSLLLSVHGYTQEALEGASTNVPAILKDFITNGGGPRLQAVRALALYPNDEMLAFIQKNLAGAPVSLKRQYAMVLTSFGHVRPQQVTAMLENLLADADLSVRHAAVYTANTMYLSERLQQVLQSRLRAENDQGLRKALKAALGGTP